MKIICDSLKDYKKMFDATYKYGYGIYLVGSPESYLRAFPELSKATHEEVVWAAENIFDCVDAVIFNDVTYIDNPFKNKPILDGCIGIFVYINSRDDLYGTGYRNFIFCPESKEQPHD
jgi:hypothetical protein